VEAPVDSRTRQEGGRFGSSTFTLHRTDYDSLWHDIPLWPNHDDETILNLVTEIPMFMTAKMEVQKAKSGNPIVQDTNDDGSIRYYTYGTPFFNYGLVPQTWEDPNIKSAAGRGGDNDPLDVIELGSGPLLMGSITPCRILGSWELIDEGETDQKILCIALTDKDASSIHSLDDLERIKPGHLDRLRDWLTRYKTSEGKAENSLASETPKPLSEALEMLQEMHQRWKSLCGKDGSSLASLSNKASDFWLDSPGCRGD
jgi:3'-phosphoadenosine 5'-phosphosulfate synthase